jgi:hypothetical protein
VLAEYDYVNLAKSTKYFAYNEPSDPENPNWTYEFKHRLDVGLVGVNYRF